MVFNRGGEPTRHERWPSRQTGNEDGLCGPLGKPVAGAATRTGFCPVEWLPPDRLPELWLDSDRSWSSCGKVEPSWESVETSCAVLFRSAKSCEFPLLNPLFNISSSTRPDTVTVPTVCWAAEQTTPLVLEKTSVSLLVDVMLVVRAAMDEVSDDKDSVCPTADTAPPFCSCSSTAVVLGVRCSEGEEALWLDAWLRRRAWEPGNWQKAFITWLTISKEPWRDVTWSQKSKEKSSNEELFFFTFFFEGRHLVTTE